ncbi:VOC family protein [Actinophytocola xanthii]|uniref:hypothetical protein n=1 Tax=Actinophytocola xanthii TaxID=1912961 RepID=UPI001E3D8143|nr:hypothetical protein [Actinophytocola xanthii]
MANELTIPLLPCPSIDEIASFYEMLGFEITYRQTRPNPHVAVRREDINLHFFGMDGYDPAQSYSSCLVIVADTSELFEAFAAGMRSVHGKLLSPASCAGPGRGCAPTGTPGSPSSIRVATGSGSTRPPRNPTRRPSSPRPWRTPRGRPMRVAKNARG